jgi:glycosyltransferase involved in cell wall biosynthesis
MAMCKTVVATPGAATGLKAAPNEEIIVAQDAPEIAAAIIGLLKDPEQRKRIGRNARAYVERAHSWDAHLARLGEWIKTGKP